jgi:hypothetical protein
LHEGKRRNAGWRQITVIMPDDSKHMTTSTSNGDIDLSLGHPLDATDSTNEETSTYTAVHDGSDETKVVSDPEEIFRKASENIRARVKK